MRDATIVFRAVFEPGASGADRELLSVAATEVIADFSAPMTVEEDFLDLAPPEKPPHLRCLVFLRSERPSGVDGG
jgi:hypothetical protein